MTRFVFAAALLAVAAPAHAQVEKARAGRFSVEQSGKVTRLIYDNVLFGSQYTGPYLYAADCANAFAVLTPWDGLAAVGAYAAWNPTHEPQAYYHRAGPVGAVFQHVRGRKGGADAAAPVGVVGMYAGSVAAYARRGQAVTFYESHRELKKLVVDTDQNFTFLADARARGATVDVRFGPVRTRLAADAEKRFAVLLVEMIEADTDPGDRLTVEAVRLYTDRLTADGVIALHISNREFRLEPVVARLARELKLVGRVWDDPAGHHPGKVGSTWCVLARSEAALGPLAGSLTEQVRALGTHDAALGGLLARYPDDHRAAAAIRAEWLGARPLDDPSAENLSTRHGPQARNVYDLVRKLWDDGEPDATLARLTEVAIGKRFRPFAAGDAPLRTDDDRPDLPLLHPAKR